MKQALGWAISLWGLEREVSRLEGGDGDIGSGRGVKANWCHHSGLGKGASPARFPFPAPGISLGMQGCP